MGYNFEIADILDAFPLTVLIVDKDLRILYANKGLESLTFFSKSEVKGVYFDYILRTNIHDKIIDSIKNNELSNLIQSIEGDIINKNRKKIPIRLYIAPLFDSNAEIMAYQITVQDVSLIKELNEKVKTSVSFDKIIGQSPKMKELFEILPIIANSDSSILITGETGTGKDLLAEEIHRASKRADNPFIKVNCGAIPASLLESELFGHVKGAFTGATTEHPGFFRMANGGTLYLTEIGDLPLSLQVKLLTVLDDKAFYPIGSSKKVNVDVRVIAGTHKDLASLVMQRKFREDLFFRLNVVKIHLPPLRERGDDLQLLISHFIKIYSNKLNKKIKGFNDEANSILKKYLYPGNIRELRNIVEYACTLTLDEVITTKYLPHYVLDKINSQQYSNKLEINSDNVENKVKIKKYNNYNKYVNKELDELINIANNSSKWIDIEKQLIVDALKKTKGNRTRAAKLLGWARSTLWRKIKEYEI